jgi:hypothetical protein
MKLSAVPTSEIEVETDPPFDRTSALREQSVNEVIELLRRAGLECELVVPDCSPAEAIPHRTKRMVS